MLLALRVRLALRVLPARLVRHLLLQVLRAQLGRLVQRVPLRL